MHVQRGKNVPEGEQAQVEPVEQQKSVQAEPVVEPVEQNNEQDPVIEV